MKNKFSLYKSISYQPKNSQKNGVDIRAESVTSAQTSDLLSVRLHNHRTLEHSTSLSNYYKVNDK